MAYTPHNWLAGHVLSIARMDNLETQYQEILNLFNAHTILFSTLVDDPEPLTVGASTVVGRKAAGNISAMSGAETMVILSGQAGADFSMNTNKITSVTDPGAAQDAATKNYVDTNDVDATREFFVPAIDGGTTVMYQQGPLVDTVGDKAWMKMIVPHDFTALSAIEIIFLPGETGASMNFVVTTRWGAYNGGEAYNVGGESEDPRDIGATVNQQNLAHSISDLVDVVAFSAGDLLGVEVDYDAAVVDSNAFVRGLRLRYT